MACRCCAPRPRSCALFLKKWDEIAAEEGAKNPFFKKVHD